MKKNLFYFLATVLLSATVVTGLTACGDDDDDEGGGSSSTTAGVIDAKSGLRIKGVGNYNYYYTDDGRIDYISDRYGKWTFGYNPNTVTFVETYNGRTSKEETVAVSYNKAGYLAGINYNETKEYSDGDEWTTTGKSSLSYDGSGHLTKISSSANSQGKEGGKNYTEKWSDDIALTWKNNQLQKIVWVESGTKNGESWKSTETWNFTYDSDNENPYCQWAPSIAKPLDDDIIELMAYAGLLGKGPSMLPDGCEYEDVYVEDGDTDRNESTKTYRYDYNDDGSISSTTINSTRYSFYYDYNSTRANDGATPKTAPAKKLNGLFMHARRR